MRWASLRATPTLPPTGNVCQTLLYKNPQANGAAKRPPQRDHTYLHSLQRDPGGLFPPHTSDLPQAE